MSINKKELKYILAATIFAAVYFFLLLPKLVLLVDGNSVIMNFFIFNLGMLMVITIYMKSRTLSQKIDLRTSFEYLLVVLALDSFIPAYHIDIWKGTLLNGAMLSLGTTDYFFGYIGINFLHLSGVFVAIWAYVVVPAILLYLAAKISKSNFIRHV